jgi:hypothetical protein
MPKSNDRAESNFSAPKSIGVYDSYHAMKATRSRQGNVDLEEQKHPDNAPFRITRLSELQENFVRDRQLSEENRDEIFPPLTFSLHSQFKPELLKSECDAFSIAMGRYPDVKSITELYQFKDPERNARDIDAARLTDQIQGYPRSSRIVDSTKAIL